MKIFYKEDTLQIMGFSDSAVSMAFPYIEVEETYHSSDGIFLEKDGEKLKLLTLE